MLSGESLASWNDATMLYSEIFVRAHVSYLVESRVSRVGRVKLPHAAPDENMVLCEH